MRTAPRRTVRTFLPRLAVAVPLVVLASAAGALGAAAAPQSRGAVVPLTASSVRFASPTVVDEFVPGFEPDVVQDGSATANRGRYYSSWPNGFSTTISYLETSTDGAASFHRTAGSVGGKPFTCVGGGDSELQIDGKDGQLLFADLQGLTNFSTSTSTDGGKTISTQCVGIKGLGVDRQWIAVDDNGGTSSIGSGANDGRAYLFYDNVAQGSSTNNPSGNEPVVNATTDGINYGGCDPTGTVCNLVAAPISAEDDIVGNAFVNDIPGSARQHEVYEVRGSTDSTKVLMSSCRGAAAGTATTAAATAGLCTNPLNLTGGSSTNVGQNPNWTDHVVATLPTGYVAKSFVVGAIDTAGNIYVTWAQYKLDSSGNYASTGQVMLAHSADGGATWSAPVQLNPPAQPTVIFPWIAAGDPGRVDVVWYAAPQASDNGVPGPDPLDNGTWNIAMAQSTNALSATPSYSLTQVNDHVVKYGDISTGGLGGAADRSLGDYLQVKAGNDGQAVVSYVDDTSGNRNNDITQGSGQDPAEAAGPTMVAKQIAGPSLFAARGSLGDGTPAVGSVTDPTGVGVGDSYLAFAGQETASSSALDIGGVSVTQPDASHLQITMKTADPNLASDLAPSPTSGGLYANWRVRWAGRYGTSGNDGQIYYVGMQAGPDGTPEYYVGQTASIDTTRTKYFAYPTGTTVPGAINGGTITWTVPLSAIGTPKTGDGLFSVTGFTATSLVPDEPIAVALPTGSGQVGDEDTLTANLIDAAPSFSFTLNGGASGTTAGGTNSGTSGSGGSGSSGGTSRGGGSLATTGLSAGVPLAALLLTSAGYALHRRSRRS